MNPRKPNKLETLKRHLDLKVAITLAELEDGGVILCMDESGDGLEFVFPDGTKSRTLFDESDVIEEIHEIVKQGYGNYSEEDLNRFEFIRLSNDVKVLGGRVGLLLENAVKMEIPELLNDVKALNIKAAKIEKILTEINKRLSPSAKK